MEVSNEIEKNSVQNLHFQRLLVAGSANRPFVNALDLLNVEVGVLAGFGTIGIPASVALDALPDTKSLHVTFQDAYTKIDIIFDLEEIDAFLIDCFTPGRDVYLHDSNGITFRNRERVRAAFYNHDAGDQAGIEPVSVAAVGNGFSDPRPPGAANPVLSEEPLDSRDCGIGSRIRHGFSLKSGLILCCDTI